MFLLDTNVISEMRKAEKADARVRAWSHSISTKLQFISVVTIYELEIGVLRMERRDTVQGARLRHWLTKQIMPTFSMRTLHFDNQVALLAAAMQVPNPQSERDAYIAATAIVHGLTVVTRNVSDFDGTGARVLNPWES